MLHGGPVRVGLVTVFNKTSIGSTPGLWGGWIGALTLAVRAPGTPPSKKPPDERLVADGVLVPKRPVV